MLATTVGEVSACFWALAHREAFAFSLHIWMEGASLVIQKIKNLPAMQEAWVWPLGQKDPLEKEIATYSTILWRRKWQSIPVFLPGELHGQRRLAGYSSWDHKESDMTKQVTHTSILAWRIPWTEEPGELQSMGSQRVGHDWATNTLNFVGRNWKKVLLLLT